MTNTEIAQQRLCIQRLTGTPFDSAAAAVTWFGAVQAQEYRPSMWALGQRVRGASETTTEQAIASAAIVRTWPMRGTIHFVAAADVHWMLQLLTPRIVANSARRYRQLDLDAATFARCEALTVKALSGGKRMTRKALYALWQQHGIAEASRRGSHIIGHLAQQGVLCIGPYDGKQPTVVLLDEWVTKPRRLDREEALAEICRRYFTSHAPATLQDFMWWTGLMAGDARSALEMVKATLEEVKIEGISYWRNPAELPVSAQPSTTTSVLLLPQYDEYMVAYRDRSAALEPAWAGATGSGIFRHIVVIDGMVVGTWTRSLKKDGVQVEVELLRSLSADEQQSLDEAIQHYRDFLGTSSATLEGSVE